VKTDPIPLPVRAWKNPRGHWYVANVLGGLEYGPCECRLHAQMIADDVNSRFLPAAVNAMDQLFQRTCGGR